MELLIKERTALALLREHPEIERIYRQAKTVRDDAEKKIDELEKMARHIAKQRDAMLDGKCDEMDAALAKLGVLPSDFSSDRYRISVADGVVSIEPKKEKCDCSVCRLVGKGAWH